VNKLPADRKKEVIMQITKNLLREQTKKEKKIKTQDVDEFEEGEGPPTAAGPKEHQSFHRHKSSGLSLRGSPSKESKIQQSKRSSQKHLISLNKQLLDLNHEGESRVQPMILLHNPSESRTSQSMMTS
jgi:hypothetical protein